MGFKCPTCHKDFGSDKDALKIHLAENPDHDITGIGSCFVSLSHESFVDKEIKEAVRNFSINKNYAKVSSNHKWRKINLVSYPDGHDDIVCIKCGCKAKRYGSRLIFDWRQKDKIINCNNNGK